MAQSGRLHFAFGTSRVKTDSIGMPRLERTRSTLCSAQLCKVHLAQSSGCAAHCQETQVHRARNCLSAKHAARRSIAALRAACFADDLVSPIISFSPRPD